jgi:hypothetical protein
VHAVAASVAEPGLRRDPAGARQPSEAVPAGAHASTPKSLPRHLARGAIGFGLIGSALALTPSLGPAALLLAPPGAVALGGCPTCWLAGLIETVSAGRVQRTCTDEGCELHKAPPSATS